MKKVFGALVLIMMLALCAAAAADSAAPTDLVLSENGVLTWYQENPETIQSYYCSFQVYDNGKLSSVYISASFYHPEIYPNSTTSGHFALEGNQCSFDFSGVIRKAVIKKRMTGKPLQMKARLTPYLRSGSSGSATDYSNEVTITVNAELPELTAPTGLALDEHGVLTWDPEAGENDYYLCNYTLLSGGRGYKSTVRIYNSANHSSPNLDYWTEEGSRRKFDLHKAFESIMAEHSMAGTKPTVSVTLTPLVNVTVEGQQYSMEGPESAVSNVVSFVATPNVSSLTVTPSSPVLSAGGSLELQTAISPADAVYSEISWVSSDETVAIVSPDGRVTGIGAGTADITVSIGDVSAAIPLTVFAVESNISSYASKNVVTGTAAEIISDLLNSTDPALDRTDIQASQVSALRSQIRSGLEHGDIFHADLAAVQYGQDHYDAAQWETITASHPDAQFGAAYEIGFEIYQTDGNGQRTEIGRINALNGDAELSFPLPDFAPLQDQQTRRCYLIQYADGAASSVPVTADAAAGFTGSTARACDWILLYRNFGIELTTDKQEYLVGEDITFTVTGEGLTQVKLIDQKGNSSQYEMPGDGRVVFSSLDYTVGEPNTVYVQGSFDYGNTWIRSSPVTFSVIKQGDASFTAQLNATSFVQGEDLIISLGESAFVDRYYVGWETGDNPNQPNYSADTQEIRINTLCMAPGTHSIFVGVYPVVGYAAPESFSAEITITANDAYSDYGKLYIQGPDTVEAVDRVMYAISAKGASRLSVRLDGNAYGVSYSDSAHSYFVSFSADQTGEHTLHVQAVGNDFTVSEDRKINVICTRDLALGDIDTPDWIFNGQSILIPVKKPADADYISVEVRSYVSAEDGGYDTLLINEEKVTDDYTISLNADQTRSGSSIQIYAYSWYRGEIVSRAYRYFYLEDISDYALFSVDRETCQPGETVTCRVELFGNLLGGEIVVGEQVFPLDSERLSDGDEHIKTVTLTAPGIYSAYARISVDGYIWVNTDPIEIRVGSAWEEPVYTWHGNEVTAEAVSSIDQTQSISETVTATKVLSVSPTQDTEGAYNLTAVFENSLFETQTREGGTIPALKDMAVLRLPSAMTEIEEEAFQGIGAEAVIIPDGCETIGRSAFSGCGNLIYVSIPASVETIGDGAFDEGVLLDIGK